jgi:hypothetical protein
LSYSGRKRGSAGQSRTQPRLGGRDGDLRAATPEATGRHLHEREPVPASHRESGWILVGEALRQRATQLRHGERPRREALRGEGEHRRQVDADQLWIVARMTTVRTTFRSTSNPDRISGSKRSRRDQSAT